jgi:uncharacterized SAM-binding protein YcdF (DUF218 family)
MKAVVCLGSYDLRVAHRAADIAFSYPSARVVVTGAQGNWTRDVFEATEAEILGRALVERGLSASRITLEPHATNIGENIAFARDLLGYDAGETVFFVTKPQTQMRVRATAPKHWPVVETRVTCPLLSVDDYRTPDGDLAPLVNEMVGDLQRMIAYPALGFQAAVEIADEVLEAFEFLKSAGYTRHLMPTA